MLAHRSLRACGNILLAICSDRNFWALIHHRRNVPGTKRFPNGHFDVIDQGRTDLTSFGHLQEKHNSLISICLSPLTNAQCISDVVGEVLQHHIVDLSRPKAYACGFQDAVTATQHPQAASLGIEAHKVAMVPDGLLLLILKHVKV
jgi:hypothetical protein